MKKKPWIWKKSKWDIWESLEGEKKREKWYNYIDIKMSKIYFLKRTVFLMSRWQPAGQAWHRPAVFSNWAKPSSNRCLNYLGKDLIFSIQNRVTLFLHSSFFSSINFDLVNVFCEFGMWRISGFYTLWLLIPITTNKLIGRHSIKLAMQNK